MNVGSQLISSLSNEHCSSASRMSCHFWAWSSRVRVLLQPEQQRVLVDDRGCEGVVGLDGDLVRIEVGAVAELRQHAAAHLLRGLDGEGEAQDLARSCAALDQRDDRAT